MARILLTLTLALVAACSGYKPYPNDHEKNVRVVTRTDSSLLSSMHAAVDVYHLDGVCHTTYQGTLDLRGQRTLLGLPADRPLYLVFVFEGSSFLGGTRNTVSYETVFQADAGTDYEFTLSYADRIYDVSMRSIEGAATRPIASRRLNC